MPRPRPSATIMVLRDLATPPEGDIEVLLLTRHQGIAFMGGACVFPGGRLDDGDLDADGEIDLWCDGVDFALTHFRDLDRGRALQYHVAAIRELFEEAGILLARDEHGRYAATSSPGSRERFAAARQALHSGSRTLRAIVEEERLRLDLDALKPLAHWVTPEIESHRFDTRFFAARIPDRQIPAPDDVETTASAWMTPADALERFARDEIVLGPPTWRMLKDVSGLHSVDDALAWAERRLIHRVEPRFFEEHGVGMLVLPGDPHYPAPAPEAFTGETRFLLVNGRWRARLATPDAR